MNNYTERFLNCVTLLLQHEGGYVNDPDDAGGGTNFGISSRAFPHLNIRDLTKDDAVKIYYENYWKPIRGDELPGEELAMQVFDAAVNIGLKTAVRMLQRIINAGVDGVIGPLTLRILEMKNPEAVTERFKFQRLKFYCEIVIHNPSQVKFLRGWMKRI